MAGVEASGKNVEEAITKALAELGASRSDVTIDVISDARGGILGVGGHEARVRVTLRPDAVVNKPPAATDATPAAEGEEAAEGDEPLEDEAEFAAQMLDKLLEMMGISADVSIRDAETPGDGLGMAKAVLDVEGDDLGILIGRRGETLGSLQYLLNLMVARQLGEHMVFTVDVEGYRRRREKQLTSLAERMADQVRRTGRPVTLEPMPPQERRIIHITLANDRQVETSSLGEGEDRAVSITPRR
jgi:spoIIIJ-associated protein